MASSSEDRLEHPYAIHLTTKYTQALLRLGLDAVVYRLENVAGEIQVVFKPTPNTDGPLYTVEIRATSSQCFVASNALMVMLGEKVEKIDREEEEAAAKHRFDVEQRRAAAGALQFLSTAVHSEPQAAAGPSHGVQQKSQLVQQIEDLIVEAFHESKEEQREAVQNAPAAAESELEEIAPKFDYFLLLNFEATCDVDKKFVPQEVIEFPCLKMNARTLQVEAAFHKYVRPESYPILTPFCTELTGIVQAMVDNRANLRDTLKEFDDWMTAQGLKATDSKEAQFSSAFVTCGDWDLKTLLYIQCRYIGIEMPEYFKRWINVKKPFFETLKVWPRGMMNMLELIELQHEGRHHSGIDDVRNMANIVRRLCERGAVFELTTKIE